CFAGYKDFKYILSEEGPEHFDKQYLAKFYDKYAKKYSIEIFASTDREVLSAHKNKLSGYIYQNEILHHSTSYPFEIIDRIGGGDAYAAGILHGILVNMEAKDIVELGIASSLMKHMVYGDHNQFKLEEIQEFMNNIKKDVSR